MLAKMIEIPQEEYDHLIAIADKVDEAEDLADVARILDALHTGEEEALPSDMVERILLENANPIREFRKYRGMTGAQLAEAIGTSQGYISELERGHKEGTPSTLRKIADALNVTVDELI